MTSEDHFHQLLDQDDSDWMTRLVLADFLAELGDERAAGYQALARLGRVAAEYERMGIYYWGRQTNIYGSDWHKEGNPVYLALLPDDWWALIESSDSRPYWKCFPSRRDAEDEAARAFSRLPLARQQELLEAAHEPV